MTTTARLDEFMRLLGDLESITRDFERIPPADAPAGTDADRARAVFETYRRAVRELRAIAVETRGRVDQASAVVTDAWTFAHRRRRRATKVAAKRSLQHRAR